MGKQVRITLVAWDFLYYLSPVVVQSGCGTLLKPMSRTYKTRLLLHIPINLLEICAKLSKQSSAAVLLWEGQTCYEGMGLAAVETQSKEAMYDCFLVSTLSKSSSNLHYSRV